MSCMISMKKAARSLYASCAATIQSHLRFGTNIYSEEWDALIILDACRVDALNEVKNEYEFLSTIDTRWSKGSTSKEWITNTFTETYQDEISSTGYITANYYSSHLANKDTSPLEYPVARNRTFGNNVFERLIRDDTISSSDFVSL